MNQFDRLIAQTNGQMGKVPPVIEYRVQWVPKDTEYSRYVVEDGQGYIYTKYNPKFYPNYKAGTEAKLKVNPEWHNMKFYYYYNDPEETEEERINYIKTRDYGMGEVKMMSGKYFDGTSFSIIDPKSESHNTLLKAEKIYAQLDFELKIIRKIYHEAGFYNYEY
ncbi:hypothetical protein ACQV2T_08380 [Facklamia sp. P13069]|uniref:hypothetical protein n=1 Tax=Facklamia sp. P13069 TaxID=3421954 RepID=UPI003D1784E0